MLYILDECRLWDRRLPAAAMTIPRAHDARIRGITAVPSISTAVHETAGKLPPPPPPPPDMHAYLEPCTFQSYLTLVWVPRKA